MDRDQQTFLSLAGILPGRLTSVQAAWILGCAEHDMAILTAAGILKPLGKPAPNAPKFYALADVEEIRSTPKLLDKASAAIQEHWKKKRTRLARALGNHLAKPSRFSRSETLTSFDGREGRPS